MPLSEAETRKQLIDGLLDSAGWKVDNPAHVTTEFKIDLDSPVVSEPETIYNKKQEFSDYVLLGKNGKPIAVVEAKKTSKDAALGREQAKQYCYNIQKEHGGELPFCFYTNGHTIYFWDLENSPPRKIVGFPTREDIERFTFIRKNKKPLTHEFINPDIAGRDYQLRAIRAVLEGIESKKRDFLLVMATGTGKTRTCIALTDALMRAKHAEKVLFLVDRIALREQALDAFKEHLPNEPRWPNIGETSIAKDRRIYVSTYPTMLNIIREEKQALSPHFFDLIIVDESHRSIYNTYREVLDYFKTITVGLTATPTNVIDHNTFELFQCEGGIPSFAYTYEEAVNNDPPYLCNFEVQKLQTRFQKEGISKRTISLEEQKKLILEGKEVEEFSFEGTQLEKQVTNKGTNTAIVRAFMEECIKDQNGVLPGKTIFFCSSKSHARRVEEIFDELYPEYCGDLSKVIVSEDSRVYGKGGLLDQFTNKDFPRIAISVDMLDTGIDIRELVNLVFAKPVYSYTKFWQMIGRGTRLLEPEKIKPWCPEKDRFLVLDCWDNFEYFKVEPKGKELTAQTPLPVTLFSLRLEKLEKALELGEEEIALSEGTKLRSLLSQLPAQSVVIKEAQADLSQLSDDNYWNSFSTEKIAFLRNSIQPLLRTLSEVDFKAMRFERDLVKYTLFKLSGETQKAESIQNSIVKSISELPLSVNFVRKEEELITTSQKSSFWADSSPSSRETLADSLLEKLSPLMRFREGDSRPETIHLNFTDEVIIREKVEFGPENESVSITKYREMVEELIAELTEENSILLKIKNGEEITTEESATLANVLKNEHPHITEDLLRTVYQNRNATFLQFIKHILGIKILQSFPEKVTDAFEQFYQEHSNLSSRQMQFLDLLKTYLIERQSVEKKDLISSPFTTIHPSGIRGVFSSQEINEILALTNALAA